MQLSKWEFSFNWFNLRANGF